MESETRATRAARDHVHAGLRVGDSRVPLPTAVNSRGDTASAAPTAVPRRPTAATTDEVRSDLGRIYLDLDMIIFLVSVPGLN